MSKELIDFMAEIKIICENQVEKLLASDNTTAQEHDEINKLNKCVFLCNVITGYYQAKSHEQTVGVYYLHQEYANFLNHYFPGLKGHVENALDPTNLQLFESLESRIKKAAAEKERAVLEHHSGELIAINKLMTNFSSQFIYSACKQLLENSERFMKREQQLVAHLTNLKILPSKFLVLVTEYSVSTLYQNLAEKYSNSLKQIFDQRIQEIGNKQLTPDEKHQNIENLKNLLGGYYWAVKNIREQLNANEVNIYNGRDSLWQLEVAIDLAYQCAESMNKFYAYDISVEVSANAVNQPQITPAFQAASAAQNSAASASAEVDTAEHKQNDAGLPSSGSKPS